MLPACSMPRRTISLMSICRAGLWRHLFQRGQSHSKETKATPLMGSGVSDQEFSSSDSKDGSTELVPIISRIVDNGAEDPYPTFGVDYKPEIAPISAYCR